MLLLCYLSEGEEKTKQKWSGATGERVVHLLGHCSSPSQSLFSSSPTVTRLFLVLTWPQEEEEWPLWAVCANFSSQLWLLSQCPTSICLVGVCPPAQRLFAQQLLLFCWYCRMHILERVLWTGACCRLWAHMGHMKILITFSIPTSVDLWDLIEVPRILQEAAKQIW